jgi:hypothetical protein
MDASPLVHIDDNRCICPAGHARQVACSAFTLREESFETLPCLYAKDRFVATANAWLSVLM